PPPRVVIEAPLYLYYVLHATGQSQLASPHLQNGVLERGFDHRLGGPCCSQIRSEPLPRCTNRLRSVLGGKERPPRRTRLTSSPRQVQECRPCLPDPRHSTLHQQLSQPPIPEQLGRAIPMGLEEGNCRHN